MNIQRVKQGARINFYNGVFTILFGFFYIFLSDITLRISFRNISELWGFFLRYDPKIAGLIILFNVLVGILLISNGIFIMYMSDFIIKRKEKMTWVMLFLSGIISSAGMLAISILFKNWVLITLSAIQWVTFLFGMLLPVKYYIQKSYREY